MSAEMALDTWKWRLSWTFSISNGPLGNDFQQPCGNQSFRHFQMSSTSTPYGGAACGGRRRPAQAVGDQADRDDFVASLALRGKVVRCQSPRDHNHPLPEWPTFQPAHQSACFRPMRSSGCWRSAGSTWRQNITKATARISHRPIWPGEISRALICAASKWTAVLRGADFTGAHLQSGNLIAAIPRLPRPSPLLSDGRYRPRLKFRSPPPIRSRERSH
jgi:hypothetical protein